MSIINSRFVVPIEPIGIGHYFRKGIAFCTHHQGAGLSASRQASRIQRTERGEFEPIRIADGIVGVHSTSLDEPMKKAGFPSQYKSFEQADTYSQWIFTFTVPSANATAATGTPTDRTSSAMPPIASAIRGDIE